MTNSRTRNFECRVRHFRSSAFEIPCSTFIILAPPRTHSPIGFFQIGGGIAGDVPICVVPMLVQDLKLDIPMWSYFCQISDAVTSFGGYSGAVPNEKITWCKLEASAPKFMIQSDASIVAPLMFAYVLGLVGKGEWERKW